MHLALDLLDEVVHEGLMSPDISRRCGEEPGPEQAAMGHGFMLEQIDQLVDVSISGLVNVLLAADNIQEAPEVELARSHEAS